MMMSDIRQTRTCYLTKVVGNAGRERGKVGVGVGVGVKVGWLARI